MVSIVVLSQTMVLAQSQVGASVSDTLPSLREEITITLSIADTLDFYYGGVEVTYPADELEFLFLDTVGLSSGGIGTCGEISPGILGASVSRTSPLPEPTAGAFMELHFRVLASAYAGVVEVSFANQEIFDSDGHALATLPPDDVGMDIQADIGAAALTIPAESVIAEGEAFQVTGEVFASGVTDTARIEAWVGVAGENTDPAGWDASVWTQMDWTNTNGSDELSYTRDVAYQRPVGTWYIAMRSRLDDGPDGGSFVYGGVNGLWDADSSGNARLTITERDPYRYTLAEWDFDAESMLPSAATPANQDAAMALAGASLGGYSSGATGLAANANGWDSDGGAERYWSAVISTENFIDLQVSSAQYGSGTGPRDFLLETSTDGVNWQPAMADTIRVATNWTTGVVDAMSLPAELHDQPQVYLRWRVASDSSISGGEISSTGTSRLDEVRITGINPSPTELTVYPGDANNDSTVNLDDVLALGTWWMHRGPTPIYNTLAFEPREVEAWIPAEATYADARGDGRVDHGDLLPVGLHFGQTVGPAKKQLQSPLAEIVIDPQPAGTRIPLSIEVPGGLDLRGVSFSLSVSGASPETWQVEHLRPVFCPETWNAELLSFDIRRERIYEAAVALKGRGAITRAAQLVTFDLRVTRAWNHPAVISINRLTVSNERSCKVPVYDLQLLATGTGPQVADHQARLLPNRPNPFASHTVIPYELAERTHVWLEVMNLQGQVIATLLNRVQPEGIHRVFYDASDLPAGIYLCRLRTAGGYSQTMKMSVME